MSNVNLAIIFYTMGGTNYQLSRWAEEGAKEAGAEVRVLKVSELVPMEVIEKNPTWKGVVDRIKDVPVVSDQDLEWADAIIISTPTRFGVMASQMKQFLDSKGGLWAQGKLVNKVFSAMSSAQNPHGGQEATVLSLYTAMSHWGMIMVPPGYTDNSIFAAGGNPYGTSVSVDQNGKMIENVEGAVKHQAKRVVTVTSWLKQGQNK